MNQGLMKAQVNAGCLLFMPVDYPDRRRRDLEDLMLYTQLASTKKYSRFKEHEQWRGTWIRALGSLGALLKTHKIISMPNEDFECGLLWRLIEQHLPSFVPLRIVEEAELMTQRSLLLQPCQKAIEVLIRQVLSTPEDVSIEAYDLPVDEQDLSTEAQFVGLQIAIQAPSEDLYLILLSFSTLQALGADLLTTPLAQEKMRGNVELAFYAVHRSEAVYERFRVAIDKALKDRRSGLVSPLWKDDNVEPI